MSRDSKLYLEDVIGAIDKIQRYTASLSFQQFSKDEQVVDAVVRNLVVIGEAVKRIPEETRQKHASIERKKIAGLRDILIHEYFGIDTEIIWDVVQNKIPSLDATVRSRLRAEETGGNNQALSTAFPRIDNVPKLPCQFAFYSLS